MLYVVLMASRKLWHYFEVHQDTIVTTYPLGHFLKNLEGRGCTVKWVVELDKFGLQFAPRHAVKSQALADYIAEWTSVPDIERLEETAYTAVDDEQPWTMEYWCMNFDGSLNL